jgi:hypothetical protein
MSVGTDTTIHRRQSLSPSMSFVVPRFCLAAATTTSRSINSISRSVFSFYYYPMHSFRTDPFRCRGRRSAVSHRRIKCRPKETAVSSWLLLWPSLWPWWCGASSVLENPAFSPRIDDTRCPCRDRHVAIDDEKRATTTHLAGRPGDWAAAFFLLVNAGGWLLAASGPPRSPLRSSMLPSALRVAVTA